MSRVGKQPIPIPSGVEVARRPMPAGLLGRLWSSTDWPPGEWWTGPVDVIHGTNP